MKRPVEIMTALVVLVFLGGSLVGFFLDRPVFLSYAYSESMTPTINRGDMFLINPFARDYEVGDIVVFLRRDGWTVHRIFAVTDEGFITKGDHNVATDQQDGLYPVVTKDDIAGKVVMIAGRPLVIRGGGDFIESLKRRMSNIYVVSILIVLGVFLTFTGEKRKKRRKKRIVRIGMKTVYASLSFLVLAGFLFVTVASWGTITFTYSSTQAGGQRDGWYLPGSTFERNISVENKAFYSFYYFIEPKGERIALIDNDSFKLGSNSEHSVNLRVTVPMDTRIYREEIDIYSYPAILPEEVVTKLYQRNPYLPLVPYTLEIAGILFIFYHMAKIGNEDVLRIRTKRRSLLGRLIGDG